MECNKFVDEKIGETESPEFRAHLVGCPGCTRDVEELREVRTLYREASTEKYRGGVPKLRRFRMNWVPMAAAAAVLMMVFGLILGMPGDKPATKPDPAAVSTVYVRIHLEPWAGETRIQTALDDCWKTLDRLENPR